MQMPHTHCKITRRFTRDAEQCEAVGLVIDTLNDVLLVHPVLLCEPASECSQGIITCELLFFLQ